jgi:predicted amidohydrolase
MIGPDGSLVAAYRKVHLFDVDVPGATSRESDQVFGGNRAVVASMTPNDTGSLPIGLTVCYDLRFPELYRALTLAGALVITVPAAFSAVTGKFHWDPLLRARAIENQVFIVAAGQVGRAEGSFETWGHSLIIDPWGRTLAEMKDPSAGVIVADLDLAAQQDTRSTLPSLTHRRPTVYRRAPELA